MLGDDNEGFIYIGLTDSIAVPCPKCIEYWQVRNNICYLSNNILIIYIYYNIYYYI